MNRDERIEELLREAIEKLGAVVGLVAQADPQAKARWTREVLAVCARLAEITQTVKRPRF